MIDFEHFLKLLRNPGVTIKYSPCYGLQAFIPLDHYLPKRPAPHKNEASIEYMKYYKYLLGGDTNE